MMKKPMKTVRLKISLWEKCRKTRSGEGVSKVAKENLAVTKSFKGLKMNEGTARAVPRTLGYPARKMRTLKRFSTVHWSKVSRKIWQS